jgi:hypothetical protein
MKPYRCAAALLALSLCLAAALAHAGRDEILIGQTRKNQLAHDACVRKARQEQARQQTHPQQQQDRDGAAAGPQH